MGKEGVFMNTLLGSPASFALLAALAFFIIVLFRIRRIRFTTRLLTHISLAVALTVVLHMIRLYHMPQGGSVTPGSMIPLLLISLWHGPEAGYLGGFIFGVINMLQDPYILHPVQVLFDYPLPYMALGLAGYFAGHPYAGALAGVTGRFLCHYISGIVFFASYAPTGMSPYWYSLVFNATYLVPELLVCLFILKILPLERIYCQSTGGRNQ